MIKKEDFECERCLECCKKLTVKITEKEIKKLEDLGLKDFYKFDNVIENSTLKRNDSGCVFLKDGECLIYPLRPKVCRDYPFNNTDEINSCKPRLFKDRIRDSSS